MRVAARIFFVLVSLLLVNEAAVRLSGVVDFPLYNTDDEIRYIPKPSQSGNFLHTHRWVFNDRSMGTDSPWNSAKHPNLLLIGNSVVMGGDPYDQKDKLGPQLQQRLGASYSVWPIAAGGWTNVNEMVYLKSNPDVAAAPRFFIWEYMSGGLSGPSMWAGDLVWPRQRPICASCYIFRRYILPHVWRPRPSELPPIGPVASEFSAEFSVNLEKLVRATGSKHPGIIFLYPAKAQYLKSRQGLEWLSERAEIEKIAAADGVPIVDIARQPEWNEHLYRPDGTHPTVEGDVVLSRILATQTANNGDLPVTVGRGKP